MKRPEVWERAWPLLFPPKTGPTISSLKGKYLTASRRIFRDPPRHQCHLGNHAVGRRNECAPMARCAADALDLHQRSGSCRAAVRFVGRISGFDRTAADHFGKLRAKRRRAGKAIGAMDALIAAIALANSMILATRNTGDFEGLELPLVNPFAVHAD